MTIIAWDVNAGRLFYGGSDVAIDSGGVGNASQISVRWTIGKTGGALRMPANHDFVVTVQDDLSSMTHLECVIQGLILSV